MGFLYGGRIRRRLGRLAGLVLLAGLFAAVLYYVPTGYVLVAPGPTRDLSEVVTVEGGKRTLDGRLLMTTITTRDANPLLYLYGVVNPKADLTPQNLLMPPDQDPTEYWDLQKRLMEESQAAAKVAALNSLGYEARLVGMGVRVVDVLPDAPAIGILQKGDILLAAGGVPVFFASELLERMAQIVPGESVGLRVRRDEEEFSVVVPTMPHRVEGRAVMGVLVETSGLKAEVPLNITIDVEDVTGPSAGLMFSLEIVSQLMESDLTHGLAIAGTGTIQADGTVGPVGGVRQKVFAAERDEAEFFLVPMENAEEARSAATRLRVIPVKSLGEAIESLSGLAT